MEFRTAPEVKEIAEDLIFEHHDDLAENGPRIEWVMTKSGTTIPSRIFRIRKVTGVHAFLAAEDEMPHRFGEAFQAPPFVVVEVSSWWWMTLDPERHKGLVDHILSHLVYDDEKDNWLIAPPEFGEFPDVLQRHGFWRPDNRLKRFAQKVTAQLSLLPEAEPDEEDVGGPLTGPGGAVEPVDPETGEVLEAEPATAGGVS